MVLDALYQMSGIFLIGVGIAEAHSPDPNIQGSYVTSEN